MKNLTHSKEAEKPSQDELFNAAHLAIEQGVWTVISYLSETDLKNSISVAKKMSCSINSIHEFDWERFDETFASRKKFVRKYSRTAPSQKAKETAHLLLGVCLPQREMHTRSLYRESDIDRLHRVGIIVGASAALGEVYRINREAAIRVSKIVSAPISHDTSKLLTDTLIQAC
jgi:hypothetical protein